MKTFAVQAIEIPANYERAFAYIADPATLPDWAHAFQSVDGAAAVMATPAGSISVKLTVKSSAEHGTIDWFIEFSDGSRAAAFSRVLRGANGRSIYTFTLMPPPVPLEQLEGALEQQSQTLRRELAALARILGSQT